MEIISSEDIVFSLLMLGFEKIDMLLYISLVSFLDNSKFELKNEDFSKLFCDNVEFDGKVFKLKEKKSLDMAVMTIDNKIYLLRNFLPKNKALLEYLKPLDFSLVVKRKVNIIGEDKVLLYKDFFCDKEISYLDDKDGLILKRYKDNKNLR